MTLPTKLQKLVQGLQDDAENENYHHLIEAYERIAEELVKYVSEPVAIKIMKRIGSLMS